MGGSADQAGLVRAAGGVLWRPGPTGGVEIALVHRPRYDDWSLPKGKLGAGESPLAAAVREVHEETGFSAVVGRGLGRSDYVVLQDGQELPKTVRWWAMRALDGAFEPDDEVDEVRWLPPQEALALLTAGRDAAPLELLLSAGLDTTTVVLVRHGRAGDRGSWQGEDVLRPLDERGRRQADRLADLLASYGPARVLTAPALRCQETVGPLALLAGLPLEVEPAFGEDGYADNPDRALRLLTTLGSTPGAAVICSQGGAIPDLVATLAGSAGLPVGGVRARKGSFWALSFVRGALVDADQHEAPA